MNNASLLTSGVFNPKSIKQPYAWVGHIPFAVWLLNEFTPEVFVELGTHTGNSYFAFCQAVKEFDLKTICNAVDTWIGEEHAGLYDEQVYDEVYEHNKLNYQEFSFLHRMSFDDALIKFPNSSIDLIHIDGLHTYEAVKHDFETWLPKLKPSAIVLFHDVEVRDNGFGVFRLWEELIQKYSRYMKFSHSHGLGVLQLQEGAANYYLDNLLERKSISDLWVNYFKVLGEGLSSRYSFAQQTAQLQEMHNTLSHYHSVLLDKDAQLQEMHNSLSHYRSVLLDKDAEIGRMGSEIVAYHTALTQDKKHTL
jgi:hypothetical protein